MLRISFDQIIGFGENILYPEDLLLFPLILIVVPKRNYYFLFLFFLVSKDCVISQLVTSALLSACC